MIKWAIYNKTTGVILHTLMSTVPKVYLELQFSPLGLIRLDGLNPNRYYVMSGALVEKSVMPLVATLSPLVDNTAILIYTSVPVGAHLLDATRQYSLDNGVWCTKNPALGPSVPAILRAPGYLDFELRTE